MECFFAIAEGPFILDPEEIETGAFFSTSILEQWLASHPHEFTPLFKMIAKKFLNETKELIANHQNVS